MKQMKRSLIEAQAYECLAQTNPSLQSSWCHYAIQGLIETRNSIIKNNALYEAFNSKLKIIDLYMLSYQRTFTSDANHYQDFKSTGLQKEYDETYKEYTKLMKKAKTIIIDLAIKEEEIYYLDVIEVIRKRYKKYKKDYEKDTSNILKEYYHLTYKNMLEQAEQVIKTQKFPRKLMEN